MPSFGDVRFLCGSLPGSDHSGSFCRYRWFEEASQGSRLTTFPQEKCRNRKSTKEGLEEFAERVELVLPVDETDWGQRFTEFTRPLVTLWFCVRTEYSSEHSVIYSTPKTTCIFAFSGATTISSGVIMWIDFILPSESSGTTITEG